MGGPPLSQEWALGERKEGLSTSVQGPPLSSPVAPVKSSGHVGRTQDETWGLAGSEGLLPGRTRKYDFRMHVDTYIDTYTVCVHKHMYSYTYISICALYINIGLIYKIHKLI